MGIPVIAQSTTNSTNGTASSITLTKPTGPIANGDLLLLLVGNENSANGEGFDTIAGWTLELNYGSGGVDCYLGLYSRIADGTEGATIVVPFLGNDDGHGWYHHITGIGASPIHLIGNSQELVSNTVTVDAITTTSSNVLAFSAFSFDGSDSDPITQTGIPFSSWYLLKNIPSCKFRL